MNNLPERLDQITEDSTAKSFELELASENYKQLLVKSHEFKCDRANIKDGGQLLETIRSVRKKLAASKAQKKAPITAAGKAIEKAYARIDDPLEESEKMVHSEVTTINAQMEKEKQQALAETARINKIKTAIPEFVKDVTIQILTAKNDAELVRLQKLIGSEKSRKGFYEEFLEEFDTACSGLAPLINQRKEIFKKEAELKKELASSISDQSKSVELREEMELLTAQMDENAIRIKEKAFEQSSAIETIVGEPIVETMKAYRTQWKWRVDNLAVLAKKNPACVKTVVDEEACQRIFDAKKANGELAGETEITEGGITFFMQKWI